MSCIYSTQEGHCEIFDPDNPENDLGCDSDGCCFCESNPFPKDECCTFVDNNLFNIEEPDVTEEALAKLEEDLNNI